MKPAVAKRLASWTDPGIDRFGPLRILFSIVTLAVGFFGLALACKTLVGAAGWWHPFRPARSHRRTHSPRSYGRPIRLVISLLLSTMVASTMVADAQPARIILLRHAEKLDDPASLHLSPRGEARARALVLLLGRNSPFTSNAPVAALYATRVTKYDHSRRTGETLSPLSENLGLPVNASFDSDSYSLLARRVLNDPAYRGKTVIVCWTHHNIAQLAGALGVRPQPAPWKDKTFDRLWLIAYHEGQAELSDAPQRLLKGDATR